MLRKKRFTIKKFKFNNKFRGKIVKKKEPAQNWKTKKGRHWINYMKMLNTKIKIGEMELGQMEQGEIEQGEI